MWNDKIVSSYTPKSKGIRNVVFSLHIYTGKRSVIQYILSVKFKFILYWQYMYMSSRKSKVPCVHIIYFLFNPDIYSFKNVLEFYVFTYYYPICFNKHIDIFINKIIFGLGNFNISYLGEYMSIVVRHLYLHNF